MLTSASDALRAGLRRALDDNAYPGYVYGYPHKKAYRPLPAPLSLDAVWAGEERDALFCYVHVPFCNQRCSFCNLFTFVPAGASPTTVYLDALARDMAEHARVLRAPRFARLYLGGGTPTYFSSAELRRLVALLRAELGVVPERASACIEASPDTLDEEKVELLRELGFQRLSLGVQSFVPEELRQVNRRFDFALHERALGLIARANFPHFNIDLIYGLPGQTRASWRHSLERALNSSATSLFLYPLYVRPLTGLDRRSEQLPSPTPHQMATLYDDAVERLGAAGFRQSTMRQFRRDAAAAASDLEYRCQRDGMVGLGAGARSYTRGLHYSTPWRMVARNIRAVVEDYCTRASAGDSSVSHGFVLDQDERARRFVIQSLLFDGLDRGAFRDAFAGEPLTWFGPQWGALRDEGCVCVSAEAIRLTARGVRHSDVVGQMFFSERVERLIATYEYDQLSLLVLFRTRLEWCNYTCGYCPWNATALRVPAEAFRADEARLERVLGRVAELSDPVEFFITPKAEYLVLPYWRAAVARLLALPQVERVTVQTNLSFDLRAFLDEVEARKLALWTTYHPTEVRAEDLEELHRKWALLRERGVPFSVGIVGTHENVALARELRARLDERVYLWVNAFQREPNYYTEEELAALREIDPYFDLNNQHFPSLGRPCTAGQRAVYLDDEGEIRRCFFVGSVIGNLFRDGWRRLEAPLACPQRTCHCYVGHMHIVELGLRKVYGKYLAARIPRAWHGELSVLEQGSVGGSG